MGILGFMLMLLLNMILMLVVTLIMAVLTLMESKFLSLLQSRVGPYYVGYSGSLQYIADALKLFIKGAIMPDESNKFLFVTMPSMAVAICYTFWINSVWGPSLSMFEIEYNVVYASLLSILFSFCMVLTGYFSKNKYAVLASVRSAVLVLNLEIFLGLLLLNVVLLTQSFNFTVFSILQENYWLCFLYFNVVGLIIITFLLEVNSAPFDLAEAEGELIAGYSVELGGFYFGLYYLGEYFHLFFFSMTMATFFFGAWENPLFNFMINEKLVYYNDILFNSYIKKPYNELNYSYPYMLKLYESGMIKLKNLFLLY